MPYESPQPDNLFKPSGAIPVNFSPDLQHYPFNTAPSFVPFGKLQVSKHSQLLSHLCTSKFYAKMHLNILFVALISAWPTQAAHATVPHVVRGYPSAPPSHTASCAVETVIYTSGLKADLYTIDIGEPYNIGLGCGPTLDALRAATKWVAGFNCTAGDEGQQGLYTRLKFGATSTPTDNLALMQALQKSYPMVPILCENICLTDGNPAPGCPTTTTTSESPTPNPTVIKAPAPNTATCDIGLYKALLKIHRTYSVHIGRDFRDGAGCPQVGVIIAATGLIVNDAVSCTKGPENTTDLFFETAFSVGDTNKDIINIALQSSYPMIPFESLEICKLG